MTASTGAAVLVVDDEPPARRLIARILSMHGYRCAEAAGAADALEAVAIQVPELVIADVTMPGGSGISLIRTLRSRHPDLAALMVTGRDDPRIAAAALEGGAYGYVIKPFAPNELLIAVAGALTRHAHALKSQADRDHLEALVRMRTQELDESRAETVERLARAVDSRDESTGAHLERMSGLVHRLACALGIEPGESEMLRLASVLHDVGKIGIPGEVLLKEGPLSADERSLIETHASIGHSILAGANSALLRLADSIAWTHHERVDGTGYPRGLAGREIPLEGRIAAVADVFDALTSDRPYRAALPEHEALEVIHADGGLDPAIVEALDAVLTAAADGEAVLPPRAEAEHPPGAGSLAHRVGLDAGFERTSDDGFGGAGGQLDATARVARDAAHDLNNELLAIRGFGSMLRTKLLAAEQVADVDEILNAAARAAGVTSRLAGLGGHCTADDLGDRSNGE